MNKKNIIYIICGVIFVALLAVIFFFIPNKKEEKKGRYNLIDTSDYSLTYTIEDDYIKINAKNNTEKIIIVDKITIEDSGKLIYESKDKILLYTSSDNNFSYKIDNLKNHKNIKVNLYQYEENYSDNIITQPNIEENNDSYTCKIKSIGSDTTETDKVIVKLDENYAIKEISNKKEVKYNNGNAYENVKAQEVNKKNKYSITFDNKNNTITYYYDNDQYLKYIGLQYTILIKELSKYECATIEVAQSYLCIKDIDSKKASFTTKDNILVTRDDKNYVNNVKHSIKYVFSDSNEYYNTKKTNDSGHFTIEYDDKNLTQVWTEDYELRGQDGKEIKIDILTYVSNMKDNKYSCTSN